MPSPLRCTVCDRPVDDCQCADIDARLHDSAYDPETTGLMFKWCRRCDKHYARCRCGTPEFFILSAGADITTAVQDGLPNALGEIVVPDLKRR